MTEINFTLTRRRVLAGVLVIGLAAAAAGVGTFALFSDTEQSTNNQVSAGTLDLTVNGGDTAETSLTVSNVAPGESGTGSTLTLANNGSINGTLSVNVSAISLSENSVLEPESGDADEQTGYVELQDELRVTVSVNGTEQVNSTLANLGAGDQVLSGEPLNAGSEATVTVGYVVPGSAGNEIQSDGATIDLEFVLEQA